MSCLLSSGITRTCDFGFGGLQKIYLGNKSELESVTKDTDGNITAVTLSTGANIFQYEFEPETGQALQELQVGSPSRFVLQTLNMQLADMNQAKKDQLDALANADVFAFYEDQKDQFSLFGELGRGLRATVLSIDTGTADADAYVITITLVGGNRGFANNVLPSVIAGL